MDYFEHWQMFLKENGMQPLQEPPGMPVERMLGEHREFSELLGFPEELLGELDTAAGELLQDSRTLSTFLSAAHAILWEQSRSDYSTLYGLWHRFVRQTWGEKAPILLLLFFTSSVHLVCDWYRRQGISREILRDTLRDLWIWADHHRRHTGAWGLLEGGWLLNHYHFRLFRVGRLQYIAQPYGLDYIILRNRRTGGLCALAHTGMLLSAAGEIEERFPVTTAVLRETQDCWSGHPVQGGRVALAPQEYSKREWETVQDSGSVVLDMHIPEDGPLRQEECRESMRRAQDFFAQCLGIQASGFTVTSWLMDEALRRVLGASSNIRRFQDLYAMRMPTGLGQEQTIQRVFGDEWQRDVLHAPHTTSLQQGVLQALLDGEHFHEYAAFAPLIE